MTKDANAKAHAGRTSRADKVLLSLFDIRNIIGGLLAIYGVLLCIAGFAPAVLPAHHEKAEAQNRVNLYIGTDANWWVGLILLGVAVLFLAWALARPHRFDEVGTPERGRRTD